MYLYGGRQPDKSFSDLYSLDIGARGVKFKIMRAGMSHSSLESSNIGRVKNSVVSCMYECVCMCVRVCVCL
jgi:hypothetical protein